MLPTRTLTVVLMAVHLAQAYSPQYRRDAALEKRARTITITETETTIVTETVTETPSCVSSGANSGTPTATGGGVKPTTTPISSTSNPSTPSPTSDVSTSGNCYLVQGVGAFEVKKTYTFISEELSPDLQVSDYITQDRSAGNPWNRGLKSSNVYISGGFLNLRVPGRQNPAKDPKKAIYGGEIYTTEGNILYGSVRTRAIFDSTPGTCQGIFSYHDDAGEIDIEYMGNRSSTANPSPNQPPVFWYTNQPGGKPNNQVTGPAPTDVASAVREYRIDWTETWTKFYIDGILQKTLTADVPHVGSQWVWNNWANGSPYWSTGPPLNDNVFRIQSITMYYNTADSKSCSA